MQFTLRDFFWVVIVIALVLAWWMDRSSLSATIHGMQKSHAENAMRAQAAEVKWHEEREAHVELIEEMMKRGLTFSLDLNGNLVPD